MAFSVPDGWTLVRERWFCVAFSLCVIYVHVLHADKFVRTSYQNTEVTHTMIDGGHHLHMEEHSVAEVRAYLPKLAPGAN